MAKSAIDLTPSSLSLVGKVLDFPSKGSLIEKTSDTYKWVIRQRIDEDMFEKVLASAKQLAFPNEEGYKLQQHLEEADKSIVRRLKESPIQLVAPNALGRTVGRNYDTAYIVTTVATLIQKHDEEYVTDVLCSMILDQGGHEKGINYEHLPHRGPIRAVMSKIVHSVQLNVINSGHSLSDLPPPLSRLHPHLVDERTFAAIVMGSRRTRDNIVIKSKRFLADISLWFLFHWSGMFEVFIEGEMVLKIACSNDQRKLQMIVETDCSGMEYDECGLESGEIQMSISSAKGPVTYLRAMDDDDYLPCNYARSEFYVFDNLSWRRHDDAYHIPAMLGKADRLWIVEVAQLALDRLLNLRLREMESKSLQSVFALRVLFEDEKPSNDHKIFKLRDILPRHPQIFAISTDGRLGKAGKVPVIRPPSGEDEKKSVRSVRRLYDPRWLCKWFPHLEDVIDNLGKRCSCEHCTDGSDGDSVSTDSTLGSFKHGCRRHTGLLQFCLLLAHGISDAMGGKDASGMSNVDDLMTAVTRIVQLVICDRRIQWGDWFALAAITITGIPAQMIDYHDREEDICGWAAVQRGSSVVAASWLGLDRMLQLKNLFGLLVCEGAIRGVPDDVGLVQCERTYVPPKGIIRTVSTPLTDAIDTSEPEHYTTVFSAGDNYYHLMSVVISQNRIQIIDPSQSALLFTRALQPKRCDHNRAGSISERTQSSRNMFSFNTALATWFKPKNEISPHIFCSQTLDTPLKINALLSVPANAEWCILRDVDKCCLECAIAAIPQDAHSRIGCDNITCFKRSYVISFQEQTKRIRFTESGLEK